MRLRDTIKALLVRPVAFQPVLARVCDSATAGLMLSQALYWSERTAPEAQGWFYKTQDEWTEEICLSRWEQEGARKNLRGLGFWKEEKRGLPSRLYFRVDLDKLALAIAQYAEKPHTSLRETSTRKTITQACGPTADLAAENQQALKEAETTRDYAEITGEARQGALLPQDGPDQAKTKKRKAVHLGDTDPRYQPLVDAIYRCWPDSVPFTVTDADGAAIKKLLLTYHNWTVDTLAECVAFRRMSEGENPTAAIKGFIAKITEFASGPRNRFGDPLPETLGGLSRDEYRRAAHKMLGRESAQVHPQAPQVKQTPEQQREAFTQKVQGSADLGAATWGAIFEQLRKKVNPHSLETWLKPLRAICYVKETGVLYVQVPTPEFRHAGERYSAELDEFSKALGVSAIKFECWEQTK